MNKHDLSYKLKYILHELGMNKKQLLEECHLYNEAMSKPTLLNAINGKNKKMPEIDTLNTIINVCKASGNPKLQNISYDFLLNENISEIEAKNISIYQQIGLDDYVIDKLKQFNHPLYFDYGNIINYYFTHIPAKYFKYLKYLKITRDAQTKIEKKCDVKEILKELDYDDYMSYIKKNFLGIYTMCLDLKNNKKVDVKELDEQLEIVCNNLEFLLFEINRKLYENMKEK